MSPSRRICCVHSILLFVLSVFAAESGMAAQDPTPSISASRTGPIETGTVAVHDASITKTNGTTSVTAGGSTTYAITAVNAGPSATTGNVADTFPPSLTCTWTCVGGGGGTCSASGSGNLADPVSLPVGGSVTYTVTCAIAAAATGTLTNTATIVTSGDTNPANDTAIDSDAITSSVPTLPGIMLLILTLMLFGTAAIALRRRRA